MKIENKNHQFPPVLHMLASLLYIITGAFGCPGCNKGNVLVSQVLDDTNIADTDSDNLPDTDISGNSDSAASEPENPFQGSPYFPGAGSGVAGYPLLPGIGPETASECGAGRDSAPSEVHQQLLTCYYLEGADIVPTAVVEQIEETVNEQTWIHLRLIFNPSIVDNTYGDNGVGWEESPNGRHEFADLLTHDHGQLQFFDANGQRALQIDLDYISEVPEALSGFGQTGVSGEDGTIDTGDKSAILGSATSLDRNLNGCGYSSYTEHSPQTDNTYLPNSDAPRWDYRVVYEVWIDTNAFGEPGYGMPHVSFYVHATPVKQGFNTDVPLIGPCPSCPPEEENCIWGSFGNK